MILSAEKILILHPGKCGGTTIEHLFLRALRNTTLSELLQQECFRTENNRALTPACHARRIAAMTGFLHKQYAVNGVFNIYLQHADIAATLRLHDRTAIDSLFKIAFVRNPFPRILSAFYYNMWDRKMTFRDFVLHALPKRFKQNRPYTRNHFGELHNYTHLDGRQYADFVGKLENIGPDVNRLAEQLNVPLDLSQERKHARTISSRLYEHYSQAYDDEMVTIVNYLYRRDLDLFDYCFTRKTDYRPQPLAEPLEEKKLASDGRPAPNPTTANGRSSLLSAFRSLFQK